MQDTKKIDNPFAVLPSEAMNRRTQPLDSPHSGALARKPKKGAGWAESPPRARDKEAGTYRSEDGQAPLSSWLAPREPDEDEGKGD